MSRILRFFEHEKASYSEIYQDAITRKDIKLSDGFAPLLRSFHTKTAGKYYDLLDNGIRFKEQVGVIQIQDLTIEVLPKIDRLIDDGQRREQASNWHDILLDMLKECKFLSPESTDYANLKLKSNSILELYFEKYIVELEALLHKGLIKRYKSHEANQTALKGKLVFAKHLQKNIIHAERFYTRSTVYDKNHHLHQILRQALEVIHKLTGYSLLSDRLNFLLCEWPESKKVHINLNVFRRIVFDRKTSPYREALLIAKMILLNYHPDLRGGKQSVLALMFDMNRLWEEFIFQRFKSLERPLQWQVSRQLKMNYWVSDTGNRKSLIPDIIIKSNLNDKVMVIDTKWKRPLKNKPDDNDLRQLLSYKLYYQGDLAYLLYPSNADNSFCIQGTYQENIHKSKVPVFKGDFGLDGGLLFLNICNNGKLISKGILQENEAILKVRDKLNGLRQLKGPGSQINQQNEGNKI